MYLPGGLQVSKGGGEEGGHGGVGGDNRGGGSGLLQHGAPSLFHQNISDVNVLACTGQIYKITLLGLVQ